MADEMRSPGEFERARPGHVNHRRPLGQGVRRLEGRVALAGDEDALVSEVVGVDRHIAVKLGGLDAGDRRKVRPAESGRDDDSPGIDGLAGVAAQLKAFDGALVHAADAAAVADVQPMCEVGQVAQIVIGVGEVAVGVAREPQVRIVGQQGVPVDPEVLLGIVPTGVRLVDRDHLAMSRIGLEERARAVAGFEHDVVEAGSFEEVRQLEASGSCADHRIVHDKSYGKEAFRDCGEIPQAFVSVQLA
jgi:hypothetical protein